MINLFKVFAPEEYTGNDLDRILKSGKLTSGDLVSRFETMLQEYIGNPYIMVTGSNTYASLISLALCDLKNNDEVISSPMACLASNQPILNFGAKLVWADIDPFTGTLDPADVERKITSRTKAILHYHWGGYPGYIDEINAIGKKFGIPVIDDAIESFGAEYKERKIGNLGTPITTFSFQTVRLPNSIDGGAIAFASKELYERALRMRDFGINRTTFRDELGEISADSDITELGYNSIMNELSAYVGIKVMEKTPQLLELQRRNARIWDKHFDKIKGRRPLGRSEITPNYWIYSFLSDSRDFDMKKYRDMGYYSSKVHLPNDYYSCFGEFDNKLRGVREFSNQQLSVPSGWWVNKDELPHE